MKDDRLEAELRSLLRADAPTSAPTSLRLRASRVSQEMVAQQPDGRRSLLPLLGSVVVVAFAIVLVVAVVPRIPLSSQVPGSPAPGVQPSGRPIATPTGSETPSPSASVTPGPEPTGGAWSFRAADAGSAVLVPASDGTTYLATSPWGQTGQGKVYALDANGQVKPGWPFAPSGIAAFGTPVVSLDGTVYVYGWAFGMSAPGSAGSNAAWLWALDPGGQIKPGWPYAIQGSIFAGDVGLTLRADGVVTFADSLTDSGGSPTYEAVAIDPDGHVRAGWPVTLPGPIGCGSGGCVAMGGDDTWYAITVVGTGASAAIVALRADGSSKAGWPVTILGGEGLVLGPAGTVYAWGVDVTGAAGTAHGPKILRTRFLVLGPDGAPRPGWPVTIEGPAGIPSIAPDGTLYTTTGGEAGQLEQVFALGTDGLKRQGWPYTLPTELAALPYAVSAGMPVRATSPYVGPDSTVYLPIYHAENSSGAQGLLALTPDGQIASGWPVWLPSGATFQNVGAFIAGGDGRLIPPVFGADGTAYIAVFWNGLGAIMGLDLSGREKPGWPYTLSAGGSAPTLAVRAVGMFLTSEAVLFVTATNDGDTTIVFALPPGRKAILP